MSAETPEYIKLTNEERFGEDKFDSIECNPYLIENDRGDKLENFLENYCNTLNTEIKNFDVSIIDGGDIDLNSKQKKEVIKRMHIALNDFNQKMHESIVANTEGWTMNTEKVIADLTQSGIMLKEYDFKPLNKGLELYAKGYKTLREQIDYAEKGGEVADLNKNNLLENNKG